MNISDTFVLFRYNKNSDTKEYKISVKNIFYSTNNN